MNVKEFKAQLDPPSGKNADEWPVLVWVEGWKTVKGVLFEDDRVVVVLKPYDPYGER